MELSACIEWLFSEDEVDEAERIRRASAEGLRYVEFWGWRDKDMDAVAAALEETGVRLTSFVSEPAGRLVDRATHADFLAGVESSAALASDLGCRNLVVLSGEELRHVTREEQHRAVVDALRAAGPVARRHGVRLVLEPLSLADEPTSYLLSTREGLDIVDEVADPGVALLFDLFHSVVQGEDWRSDLGGRMDRVAHVQVADVPGRHEPGSGTIAWREALEWLGAAGYQGAVGLEYMPSGSTHDSLGLIRELAAEVSSRHA